MGLLVRRMHVNIVASELVLRKFCKIKMANLVIGNVSNNFVPFY